MSQKKNNRGYEDDFEENEYQEHEEKWLQKLKKEEEKKIRGLKKNKKLSDQY